MVDQSREVAKHDNQYKDEGLRKLKETVKALKECGLEEMVCGLMASTKRGKETSQLRTTSTIKFVI